MIGLCPLNLGVLVGNALLIRPIHLLHLRNLRVQLRQLLLGFLQTLFYVIEVATAVRLRLLYPLSAGLVGVVVLLNFVKLLL